MKRIMLFILVSFLACSITQAKKLFVEMEFHKNCIKLDDGSNKKPQPLKDENGKDLKFTSLIGALNYMSLQGWELLDTKSVTSGGGYIGAYGGASSTETKVYYIFCKEVTDEELTQVVENSFKK
ncbi:MAG: hypothetical protein SOU27_02360 [Sodaliphilus sp.]|nr:hypothetical protein [Sodaliphilus sp.]